VDGGDAEAIVHKAQHDTLGVQNAAPGLEDPVEILDRVGHEDPRRQRQSLLQLQAAAEAGFDVVALLDLPQEHPVGAQEFPVPLLEDYSYVGGG